MSCDGTPLDSISFAIYLVSVSVSVSVSCPRRSSVYRSVYRVKKPTPKRLPVPSPNRPKKGSCSVARVAPTCPFGQRPVVFWGIGEGVSFWRLFTSSTTFTHFHLLLHLLPSTQLSLCLLPRLLTRFDRLSNASIAATTLVTPAAKYPPYQSPVLPATQRPANRMTVVMSFIVPP